MLCFCHLRAFVYVQYTSRISKACVYLYVRVCVFLCIRLSGLSSTPNGLMGTLRCLSSPLEWDTLKVWGSTKAQPCLWRGVSLWRGATAVLTVAGLMVITLPGGCFVGPETQDFTFTYPPAVPQQGAERHPCPSPHFGRQARPPAFFVTFPNQEKEHYFANDNNIQMVNPQTEEGEPGLTILHCKLHKYHTNNKQI